jgi:hypothetical protein
MSETSTARERSVIAIRGVLDVITAVPYLLGFEPPTPSVIVVFFGADGRVLLVTRVDCPSTAQEWDDFAGIAVEAVARNRARARGAILVGVDAPGAPDGTGAALAGLARVLSVAGVRVAGIGQRCGRYWREGLDGVWDSIPEGVSAVQAGLVAAGICPGSVAG